MDEPTWHREQQIMALHGPLRGQDREAFDRSVVTLLSDMHEDASRRLGEVLGLSTGQTKDPGGPGEASLMPWFLVKAREKNGTGYFFCNNSMTRSPLQ